ncbi:MAG: hypothetical protein K0S47_4528 [Herbinix sp.]|jgi:hypothetical protein|nr:hypothetical protein [Herbinix sp.]
MKKDEGRVSMIKVIHVHKGDRKEKKKRIVKLILHLCTQKTFTQREVD